MTAPSGSKVIGLGLACLDQLLLWRDARQPVVGNRIVQYDVQGGGMVGTALVAVARLGGQAEFWGAVGGDWMAELILRGLRDEGVDVSRVRRIERGQGPMVVVCVDQPTGERHFLHWTGVDEPAEPLDRAERLRGAGCLLIDGTWHASALRSAARARQLGVPVVGDFSGLNDRVRALLGQVDYAVVSESCLRQACGDGRAACEQIRALGPACVVATLGRRGLVALAGDRFLALPAFDVDVVDTTGAGDVFHGAFCFGLTSGMPLEANLRFSSAVAAMKCRRLGGRAGIPSRAEVEQFLKERGP